MGKKLHASERKEKHENIHCRSPRRAGYDCLGTRIQSANRTAKTGASNAHPAASFGATCS
jgi:hypothetical protein